MHRLYNDKNSKPNKQAVQLYSNKELSLIITKISNSDFNIQYIFFKSNKMEFH